MLEHYGCAVRGARGAAPLHRCSPCPPRDKQILPAPSLRRQTDPSWHALRNRRLLGLENHRGPRRRAKGSAGDVHTEA